MEWCVSQPKSTLPASLVRTNNPTKNQADKDSASKMKMKMKMTYSHTDVKIEPTLFFSFLFVFPTTTNNNNNQNCKATNDSKQQQHKLNNLLPKSKLNRMKFVTAAVAALFALESVSSYLYRHI